MKKQKLFLILSFLIICSKSYSQKFLITEPEAEFDGYQLLISYDIVNKNQSDLFFVWVEIMNMDSVLIKAKAFKGEVGDNIKSGKNKKIIWTPEEDDIFLDEDIIVDIKGEMYERSFDKASMILLSAVVPGMGQTRISKGKPWWLTGVATYGILAGGIIERVNCLKTYDSYKAESDPAVRINILDESQKQMKISNSLFISAATLWAVNIVLVSVTPNRYKPLQHIRFSVNSAPCNHIGITMVSLKVNF